MSQFVTPAMIVDALKALSDNPSKTRASFFRGQCVRGAYIPSDQASEITKSMSFTKPSRVLGRFSVEDDNSGIIHADRAALRGFSFRLGRNGHRSDLLTQSAPVHYAKTLDQMLAFLKAHTPGQDGKRDAERIRSFFAANPESLHQAEYLTALPLLTNFASTTYWGVHSFSATNSKGETRYIKIKIAPVSGAMPPSDDEPKLPSNEFLSNELRTRIAKGDVRFSVLALLDRPNDPIQDVTVRWPDEDCRESVRLGTLVVTCVDPNDICDSSIFDPANLAEGVGYPPDEIFQARRVVYKLSLARRR
ncbi:catalase [Bradyrhizobium sp. LB11.1]|jgi:catalase|uniref:catalase n=1 Tax=Bradyrhizobium sp. LB11.1 TaxID=3156326 RepID=UPI0033988364